MCCQIPLWCGLAVRLFSDNKIIYTIVYVGCAFVTFYFLYHYEANLTQHFMPKANKSVYILGILPLCYYLFDYASTIYTDMLYTSNEFVVQFMPSICCIFYFVFIFYYYFNTGCSILLYMKYNKITVPRFIRYVFQSDLIDKMHSLPVNIINIWI